MTILAGWGEQYDRLLRSYERVSEMAGGRKEGSSDEARDALFHFYQDAYHLKDWLKHDAAASSVGIEQYISATPVLQLCADLCNGTKHFRLDRARTGDLSTGLTSQSVTVRPPPATASFGGTPKGFLPEPALHEWRVESGGQQYDAIQLARDIVGAWQQWLQHEGLLP